MASHAESAHDLLDLDISTLRQYVELFPTEGLSKVIMGYLSSGISKYPLTVEDKEAPDLSEGGVALNMDVPVSQEDCLVLMTVSILCVCKLQASSQTRRWMFGSAMSRDVRPFFFTYNSIGRHPGSQKVTTCPLPPRRLLPFSRGI
jgi:hypothetical protein